MSPSRLPPSFWHSRCNVPSPLGIAACLGWLEDEFGAEPVQVRSLQQTADPRELAAHFDHGLPHLFRFGGSVPPIWVRAKGADTRVIALSSMDEYQVIVALPGSGIRGIADLRGRRLGLPIHIDRRGLDAPRAAALRAFTVALDLAGIPERAVEWVNVVNWPRDEFETLRSPHASQAPLQPHIHTGLLHALVRGDVDAVYVKDVRGAQFAHLLGAEVVVDLGFHPDPEVRINNFTPKLLTVNTDTLRDYPHLVERVLGRLNAVTEWARQRPADAIALLARDSGWTEDWLRFAYGPHIVRSLKLDFDPANVAAVTLFKNFLLERGFLARDIDIGAWFDPEPLARVSRQRLSLAA